MREKKTTVAELSELEKIEKRIKEHIDSIIKKKELSPEDYQTLATEAGRLDAQERTKKQEEENKERYERMNQIMACTFGNK